MTSGLAARAVLAVSAAASCWGWGSVIDGVLRADGRHRGGSSGLPRGATGLAVILGIGGVLNLFWLATPAVESVLFAIGLLAAGAAVVLRLRCRSRQWDASWVLASAFALLVALPYFVQSLRFTGLNPHDDCYSYLVMAEHFRQLGGLRPDPFNFRILLTGPGGMALLQSPALALFGVTAARLPDEGVGLLLFVGTAVTLARRSGVALAPMLVLLAGLLGLADYPQVNISSYFATLSLLLALALVLRDWLAARGGGSAGAPPAGSGAAGSMREAAVAALLLAGVVALKNIAIPFAGLMCLFAGAAAMWRGGAADGQRIARDAMVAVIVFIVTAGAWYLPRRLVPAVLIALHRGHGPDAVTVGDMLAAAVATPWDWACVVVALVAAGAATARAGGAARAWVSCVIAAAIAGAAVTTYATGGVAIARYDLPLLLVAYVAAAVVLVPAFGRRPQLAVAVAVAIGFYAFRLGPPVGGLVGDYFSRAPAPSAAAFPPPGRVASVRGAQATMAAGAAALLRTDMPFLFDFTRNRLYVSDLPGSAGPPPGFPWRSDDAAIVTYLRASGIRYLVYAYADQANFPAREVERRLTRVPLMPWQRAWHRPITPVQDRFRSISHRWPAVFDDGRLAVVDLWGQPGATRP